MGGSEYFRFDPAKEAPVAALILRAMDHSDPRTQRPGFSPTKQLHCDEFDRIAALHGRIDSFQVSNVVRAAIVSELLVLLTLLDHHPHSAWKFRTRTGALIHGEDGIAVAMYRMFVMGHFSIDRLELRVDPPGLAVVDRLILAEALHIESEIVSTSVQWMLQRCQGLSRVLLEQKVKRVAEVFQWEQPSRVSEIIHQLLPLFSQENISEARALCLAINAAHSLHTCLATCGLALSDPQHLPPVVTDRVTGLFLDSALLSLTESGQKALTSSEREFVCEELQWVSFAVSDRVFQAVKSLEKRSPTTLTLSSLAQTGVVPAGRAMALLKRADGSPPVSFSL